jgi:hypothetical protein
MQRITRILVAGVLALGFLASSVPLQAQSESTAPFLLISPGARAGGMGEVGVANVDDATATYWNPAALTKLKRRHFSMMHSNWLPQFNLSDLYYDFAAYTHHFEDIGTFGLSATYLNLGEQEITDETGQVTGTFSSNNLAVGGSYGMTLNETMALGFTLKYIYMNLAPIGTSAEQGDGQAGTIAADFGYLWTPKAASRMTFGAALSNMGPKLTFIDSDQADPLPMNIKFGITYLLLNGEHNKLSFSNEINKELVVRQDNGDSDAFYKAIFNSWIHKNSRSLNRMNFRQGLEYWYNDIFAIRAGYFHEGERIGGRQFFTFGSGLYFSGWGFDFGIIVADADESPLANTMRFSLTGVF